MNRIRMKSKAKEFLKDKWMNEILILGVFLLATIIPAMLSKGSNLVGLVVAIVVTPIEFGHTRRLIRLGEGKEETIEGLLYYYKEGIAVSIILLSLLVGIQTYLWTLLFIIPGLVATYRYALYEYIKIDKPELKAKEIIKLSSNMMYGHKMELLVLQFSFMGWVILGAVTIVGIIPVSLYIKATMIEFYKEVKVGYIDRNIFP